MALQLIKLGVGRSHAYMIARGERKLSLKQALRIRRESGAKVGPLANVPDRDIPALERLSEAA